MASEPKTELVDFRVYYDLETYLFDTVSPRFAREGILNAFDFFCIIIWKANRAKSKIAKRILAHRKFPDLGAAVSALTRAISTAKTPQEKMEVLINDWGFLLPMASAILTILYPGVFTVYDERVCEILGDFKWVANKTHFYDLWNGYEKFIAAVQNAAPKSLSLRDKDRWLWGRSFAEELQTDIGTVFARSGK